MGGFLVIAILLTAVYTFGIVAWEDRNTKPKSREEQRLKEGSTGMFFISLFILLVIVFIILQQNT